MNAHPLHTSAAHSAVARESAKGSPASGCVENARTRRGGFTAVEVLTVLGLMSVVMAIVAPRFAQPRAKATVHAASSQLMALLETARAAAVRRGQPASFHMWGSQISITVDQNGSPVNLVAPMRLDPALSVQMASAAPDITFNARGFVSNITSQVSLIVSRDAESDTICVTRGGAIVRRGCGL